MAWSGRHFDTDTRFQLRLLTLPDKLARFTSRDPYTYNRSRSSTEPPQNHCSRLQDIEQTIRSFDCSVTEDLSISLRLDDVVRRDDCSTGFRSDHHPHCIPLSQANVVTSSPRCTPCRGHPFRLLLRLTSFCAARQPFGIQGPHQIRQWMHVTVLVNQPCPRIQC